MKAIRTLFTGLHGAGSRAAVALRCVLAVALSLSGPGIAAGADDVGEPLWEAAIGVFPSTFPAYRGSSEQKYYLIPFPFLVYRGEIIKADRHGLRALLFDSRRLELNISSNASVPASSDGTRRDGMPDLDTTVEFGPSLNILLSPPASAEKWQLKLPVRLAVATDFTRLETVGGIFHPHLNYDTPTVLSRWNLGFDVGPLFATRDYHDYYYRVKPQYARADRPVYRPAGGYSGTLALLSLSRRFENYWVGGFVRFDYLKGAEFEDSPLVDTDYSLMAGVAVSWFYAKSKRRVTR